MRTIGSNWLWLLDENRFGRCRPEFHMGGSAVQPDSSTIDGSACRRADPNQGQRCAGPFRAGLLVRGLDVGPGQNNAGRRPDDVSEDVGGLFRDTPRSITR
jgi:hypothetical protein